MTILGTTSRGLFRQLQYSMMAFALLNTGLMAQDAHTHVATDAAKAKTPTQAFLQGELLKAVRNATERFQNVAVAEQEGYALQFGCVTGPDEGAMGLHYVNGNLVGTGTIDVNKPQIVIYEAQPGGGLKLIGADFLVLANQWNAAHDGPPELMGQLFHLFDAPNRFGLPPFYTLHVWAWKENPKGAFTNWHPNVSCESFAGKK
ncbi:MAG: hypothetical protein ABI759_17835 [Candidatus Solibacter sp.]